MMNVSVQLSDGRCVPLEDLIRDYERLLREKNPKEEVPKGEPAKKVLTAELKVGEWFLIDRDVIERNKEKIHCECLKAGNIGEEYWKHFEEANKIADSEPERYTRRIKTYIFKHDWDSKTEWQMRNMCKEIGDGMCNEVICDLELQMRICNGESADDLFNKADKLPCVRLIQLRNGETGHFGGGADYNNDNPPAYLLKSYFLPSFSYCKHTPYAFQREFS